MRVEGTARILPPVNHSKGDRVLFNIKSTSGIYPAQANDKLTDKIERAIVTGSDVTVFGELRMFSRNRNVQTYILVMEME